MNATAQSKEIPPPMAMLQLISGFWISRCIYVTAKLGIPDLLNDGPKTADELAAATSTHPQSLFRLLRALAAVNLLTVDGERFGNTPVSETLRADIPGSLRAFAMTELGEEHYPAWGELLHSVRTGEIAFERAFKTPIWEFFAKNPDNAKIFNDAMIGARDKHQACMRYRFAGIKTIATSATVTARG